MACTRLILDNVSDRWSFLFYLLCSVVSINFIFKYLSVEIMNLTFSFDFSLKGFVNDMYRLPLAVHIVSRDSLL